MDLHKILYNILKPEWALGNELKRTLQYSSRLRFSRRDLRMKKNRKFSWEFRGLKLNVKKQPQKSLFSSSDSAWVFQNQTRSRWPHAEPVVLRQDDQVEPCRPPGVAVIGPHLKSHQVEQRYCGEWPAPLHLTGENTFPAGQESRRVRQWLHPGLVTIAYF